jgi:hypothetical protein
MDDEQHQAGSRSSECPNDDEHAASAARLIVAAKVVFTALAPISSRDNVA